jgi:hypothetical protein
MLLPLIALFCFGASVSAKTFKYELEAQSYHYGRGDCFSYRISGGLVMGRVTLLGPPDPMYSVILSIYGDDGSQPISLKDVTDAPFSFKAADAPTNYTVCLRAATRPGKTPYAPNSPPVKIPLSLSVGTTLDSFDMSNALEMLKPLEREFNHLQGVMKKIAGDMGTFHKNEESMRDVNESSLEKVTWFSIASILFLIGLGLFQLFHLKGFFIAKKLI